ncbi:MAG TPA: ATP-dependent protease ATPase subunit HslU [Ktedonobacterales bacterium]|jgi:ATP-dependent HslUV protease ATP-binding subunit HslU|nr:ATP-dependent protease ATPase subunit HslU [Ktedonobacterales bacterium]
MKDLTPQQIVRELDRYIVGQNAAKRSVAIALRNRYRRLQLPADLQSEITPKNILMIGPTGVGKTEIARRLAKMADAPFIKVEATKFTQVGYVGRDVESIIRDLMETAVGMVHEERVSQVRERAAQAAEKKILDILTARAAVDDMADVTATPVSTRGASITSAGSGALTTSSASSSSNNSSAKPSAAPARRRKPTRKSVAERLARNELDEQMIEIELEPEDAFPSVFEFMAGFAGDEAGGDFQEILSAMPSNRRRSRQVSVKDARRLLTQEEANKLVDLDEVIEEGTKRVEQSGVVFLDEIDKVAGAKSETGPDVSGEGVQRDLLPIIEGSTVMTRFGPVKTDHVLWITAGAFHSSKPSDLIPELQGRLPLRVELSSLTQDDYVRILTQPENSLVRQFQALLGVEGVSVEFTPDGLEEIARCATTMNERVENIGARRLHTITERVLEEVSFNAPALTGETVTVDAAFVDERLGELLKDEDLSRYIL